LHGQLQVLKRLLRVGAKLEAEQEVPTNT
jgi:hypothetical protein